jgi:hypothetical protein
MRKYTENIPFRHFAQHILDIHNGEVWNRSSSAFKFLPSITVVGHRFARMTK